MEGALIQDFDQLPNSREALKSKLTRFHNEQQLETILIANLDKLVVLYFWVEWEEACNDLIPVVEQMAEMYPDAVFLIFDSEKVAGLAGEYEVDIVPSFVLLQDIKHEKVEGADPGALREKIEEKLGEVQTTFDNRKSDMTDFLQRQFGSQSSVVAIDGTVEKPKDENTQKFLRHLSLHGVKYGFLDINNVKGVGKWVKYLYPGCKSFPQLFVNGQPVGSSESLATEESLLTALPDDLKPEDVVARIERLIKGSKVILFMKGTPTHPRCKYSRKINEIFSSINADFAYYDILTDLQLREKLKKYSNWPTYPQLYIDGELIGGIEIVEEMKNSGELEKVMPIRKVLSLQDRLKELVNQEPVMLFMKGIPSSPECGFSQKTVNILKEYDIPYGHFNILADPEVRAGLKEYSKWPTYPQLYVKGELIGGIDIIQELHDSNEFHEVLQGN
eukprot:CAMPEP_0114993748 /NCGR_PEP_ID=MMETSP0216-20121206/12717_1 /TAXON_ID=223996 /ORGANISM="Protocruzia adherens, Strain Boccale" /LENGTH=445 /DNA_ID=CAMNT_0002357455 /DNA_START=62 /DNA_END=1399 /DNA_ORIENTATION=+